MKKHLLTTAITAALGLAAANAHAVAVTSIDLTDFDLDGLRSDFAFFSAPSGSSSNVFGFTPENCINGSGGLCVDIVTNGSAIGTDVFASGFNFGGTGQFKPNVTAGGVVADITGTSLTFSALNFGGTHPGTGGTQFFLPPDILAPGTGAPGSGYLATVTDIGAPGGDYGIVVRYVGTINSPGSPFNNFQANWRIEGIAHTTVVPVPAAVWLFGTGLLGLAGVARRKVKQS